MSKIKKIKATKKNWLENLERLFSRGVNPHSKGLILVSLIENFIDTSKKIINTNKAIIIGISKMKNNIIIFLKIKNN